VAEIGERLKIALEADYVVLGGGNCKKLKKLPPDTPAWHKNLNAFLGRVSHVAEVDTTTP